MQLKDFEYHSSVIYFWSYLLLFGRAQSTLKTLLSLLISTKGQSSEDEKKTLMHCWLKSLWCEKEMCIMRKELIKKKKTCHQVKDCLSGSLLWGDFLGFLALGPNLNLLLMSVSESHHVNTGPDHKEHKENVISKNNSYKCNTRPKCCTVFQRKSMPKKSDIFWCRTTSYDLDVEQDVKGPKEEERR